jgi:hypothetical protein
MYFVLSAIRQEDDILHIFSYKLRVNHTMYGTVMQVIIVDEIAFIIMNSK